VKNDCKHFRSHLHSVRSTTRRLPFSWMLSLKVKVVWSLMASTTVLATLVSTSSLVALLVGLLAPILNRTSVETECTSSHLKMPTGEISPSCSDNELVKHLSLPKFSQPYHACFSLQSWCFTERGILHLDRVSPAKLSHAVFQNTFLPWWLRVRCHRLGLVSSS